MPIILATTQHLDSAQNNYAPLVLHSFLVLERQIKKEQEVKQEGVVCVKSLVWKSHQNIKSSQELQNSHLSSCLRLPNIGIKGMNYHTWPRDTFWHHLLSTCVRIHTRRETAQQLRALSSLVEIPSLAPNASVNQLTTSHKSSVRFLCCLVLCQLNTSWSHLGTLIASIRLSVEKSVGHFPESRLTWKGPPHCEQCHPGKVVLADISKLVEPATKCKPVSSTPLWFLPWLLFSGGLWSDT